MKATAPPAAVIQGRVQYCPRCSGVVARGQIRARLAACCHCGQAFTLRTVPPLLQPGDNAPDGYGFGV